MKDNAKWKYESCVDERKVDWVVYKMDSGKWAIAVNSKTDCKIYIFRTKARAIEASRKIQDDGSIK